MTTIITKRLLIRTATESRQTILKMVEWLNDPEVVKYSEQRHQQHTESSQRVYLMMFGGTNQFMEIHRGDDFVGTITSIVDVPNSVANVGIMIGKEYWGDGIGTEAWTGFCDHLFSQGIRKIESGCMKPNLAMIRIFGNYDMFFEATKINHFLLDGVAVDAVYYGKFAP